MFLWRGRCDQICLLVISYFPNKVVLAALEDVVIHAFSCLEFLRRNSILSNYFNRAEFK